MWIGDRACEWWLGESGGVINDYDFVFTHINRPPQSFSVISPVFRSMEIPTQASTYDASDIRVLCGRGEFDIDNCRLCGWILDMVNFH